MKKKLMTIGATILLAASADGQSIPTPDKRLPLVGVDQTYLYEYKDNIAKLLTDTTGTTSTKSFPADVYGKTITHMPTDSGSTGAMTISVLDTIGTTISGIPVPEKKSGKINIPPRSSGGGTSSFDRAGNKQADSATDLITENARMIQQDFLEAYGKHVTKLLHGLQREALLIKEFAHDKVKLETRITMKDSLDGSGFFHWLKKDRSGNSELKNFSISDAKNHIEELEEYIQGYHVNRELRVKDLNSFLVHYADKDLALDIQNIGKESTTRMANMLEENEKFLTELNDVANEINIGISYQK